MATSNQNPYCWQPLKLAELPQLKQCKMCGQNHHLLPLNKHIVFWVHQNEELNMCTAIAFKTSYLNGLKHLMEEKTVKLNKQISKEGCKIEENQLPKM